MLTAPTRIVAAIALVLLAGCATDVDTVDVADEPYVDHDNPVDYEPVGHAGKADGVRSTFQANNIMSDGFFNDAALMHADALQAFLEDSPYGNRSWLADENVDGSSFAEVLVETSREFGINPVMLLARMQVETGLVSKTARPPQSRIDRALGCGCADGESCRARFSGMSRQLRCAASTLRNRFDDSASSSGTWMAGSSNQTLDGRWVVPANHATAALYAYTPWVLEGRGGTWLVWNVTRKYERHLEGMGYVSSDVNTYVDPFVGTPCTTNAECGFAGNGGAAGFCLQVGASERGFCSLPCEGYCPDKAGYATTFCVALPNSNIGVCASKAEAANDQCRDLPEMLPTWATRYVGNSGAPEKMAEVCLP